MRSKRDCDDLPCTALEGGVASDVALVREPGGREVVIKRALARLKVAADWRSDPARSTLEVRALHSGAELLGAEVVPRVLWVDPQTHRFAMERVDVSFENWRAQLSSGRVDPETAVRAGELLAGLHARSAQRPHLAGEFANRDFFEQLRIVPFFIRSAERNPDAGQAIGEVIRVLRAPGRALVHGDYSPKNILARGRQIVILDWEVAHWGDPRFDLAFCLSHLLLGGSRFSTSTARFRQASIAFAEAYLKGGLVAPGDPFLSPLTGCLVLARLDGDAPVDYLGDLDVPRLRRVALQLMERRCAGLLDIIDQVLAAADSSRNQ